MTATLPHPDSPPATFDPRIVAFVCKWCTYAGADLAGTSRMTYPPNVRALMLPCTGRIDIMFVIRAFLQGADGVLVSGCHPGDCHYTAGNYRARRRWALLRDLLDTLGFDLRRFELAWISAAEGAKWVKTIDSFTQRIRELGPYTAMHEMAGDRTPGLGLAGATGSLLPVPGVTVTEGRSTGRQAASGTLDEVASDTPQPDAALSDAIADALKSGRIKAALGWGAGGTLGRRHPTWITLPEEAAQLVLPGDEPGNLARLLKNPAVRPLRPAGIVARAGEMRTLNLLRQEAQLAASDVIVFAIGPDGRFAGTRTLDEAAKLLVTDPAAALPTDQPVGFSAQTLAALDQLMAQSPDQRWAFWHGELSQCLRCNACRGSCPLCYCDLCLADKNQPQWLPTAADGAGNFAWQVMRAFHLAGRCVGCGACQAACPARIPLNLLGAALARSAYRHFGYRAGLDPAAPPLQADYKPADPQQFIL